MEKFKRSYNLTFTDKKLHKDLRLLALKKDITLNEIIMTACKTYLNMNEAQRKQAELLEDNE